MAFEEQETHRPSGLKQQNKPHKHGRHRSKGSISISTKGKVSIKQLTSRKTKSELSRVDRRNQLLQQRIKKREEALSKKRQLGGSSKTPPFLACIVPLDFEVFPEKLVDLVFSCDPEAKVTCSSENILHIGIPRWKQRFSFVTPERGNLYATLDALKVADTVIFLASALSSHFIDEPSSLLLSCISAQGLPSAAVCLLDIESVPMKKRQSVKQDFQKELQQWLPHEKIFSLEKKSDALNLLRKIGNQKQRAIVHRDSRPHLLAESINFQPDNANTGTLRVSGYLRGRNLSANSLVHIPGWGDFQLSRIDGSPDEHTLDGRRTLLDAPLSVADSRRVPLVSENIPDPMDAEQTWPTQAELKEAEKANAKRRVKRVPKGTSDYQAAWIPDEDGFDESDDGEENEENMEMDQISNDSEYKEWEDVETVDGVESDQYDEKMFDEEEEKSALKAKREAAKEEAAFPDEVDTPQDVAARDRFQKYRGLASFRTSPWDPKENLPSDYARIFQFENFQRTKRRVLKELDEQLEGAPPGYYITIHVINVPCEMYNSHVRNEPLVIFGMLPHEHQMSVLNLLVKRSVQHGFYQEPIKSKERVVVQCGYRRFCAQPIYSQHTNGSKHKYERFFQLDSTMVATLYGPIMFPPASVLMFTDLKEKEPHQLLATGRLLSVNPDRLIVKRAILSGHPFRVLKRTAIIRLMFFNREDINWFKPIELRTKYGRRGHIKEPLGTHGHMKCVFDDQLKSQDTVLLNLYKRVYPKWSYEPLSSLHLHKYKLLPIKANEKDSEEME